MQQMYELWLQLTNQSRRTDNSAVTPPPEDKQVTISADYTDDMVSGVTSERWKQLVACMSNLWCAGVYHFRGVGGCLMAMTSERCCDDESHGIAAELQTEGQACRTSYN